MSNEEAIVNAIANAVGELRAELHAGFADLSGKIDQTNTRLDQTNTRLDRTITRLDSFQSEVLTRLDRLEQSQEDTCKKLDGISQFLVASERGNSMLESRVLSLERRVGDMEGKQKPA